MYYSLRLISLYAGTLEHYSNAEVRCVGTRDMANRHQPHRLCASIPYGCMLRKFPNAEVTAVGEKILTTLPSGTPSRPGGRIKLSRIRIGLFQQRHQSRPFSLVPITSNCSGSEKPSSTSRCSASFEISPSSSSQLRHVYQLGLTSLAAPSSTTMLSLAFLRPSPPA
jgi:hypothetical protein